VRLITALPGTAN